MLRDDPYTPAEVPVPGSRRSRHRDLPAKVRRRQAVLLGVGAVVVLLLIVVAANAIFGGGGDDEDEPLPLKKLAGQSIIAKLGKGGPEAELLRRVRKGQIGGVIATAPTDPQTLSAQVDQLQQAASDGDNPQLLVMIDQEGGEVKRLDGPPSVDPPDLGEAGADAARSEGEETGNFLKTANVNVDLAPVLDVELPQTADSIAERTFSDDAAVVSEVGTAFIQGLQTTGVAATAKHFPGLGPATLNTDDSAVTIDAVRDETLQEALQPFQAAVDAGVELVMVSSAIYPDYGPENPRDPNRPASTVKAIVDGLLREPARLSGRDHHRRPAERRDRDPDDAGGRGGGGARRRLRPAPLRGQPGRLRGRLQRGRAGREAGEAEPRAAPVLLRPHHQPQDPAGGGIRRIVPSSG